MALALTVGPRPGSTHPTDEQLRAAWEVYGGYLLADCPPTLRPWAWWAFEPHVPADLRAERPALHPAEDAEAVRQARDDLDQRRADWLAVQAEHHDAEEANR